MNGGERVLFITIQLYDPRQSGMTWFSLLQVIKMEKKKKSAKDNRKFFFTNQQSTLVKRGKGDGKRWAVS